MPFGGRRVVSHPESKNTPYVCAERHFLFLNVEVINCISIIMANDFDDFYPNTTNTARISAQQTL